MIWNIVYTLLSLKRVAAFRQVIGDYSADEGHSPVRWLRMLIILIPAANILPVIVLIFGKTVFAGSFMILIPAMLIPVKMGILSYNIASENYVMFDDIAREEEEIDDKFIINQNHQPDNGSRRLNRERFEHYIRTIKPYLNPHPRIMDMAADLSTNRTYLSNFINSEYSMNFSRYINRLRLKELDSLRLDTAFNRLSGIELVIHAGFSSFRGYLRAKSNEDRIGELKEF